MHIKNVVIINDFNYVQGGASKVAIVTARLLKQQGFKVYFFSAVSKKEEEKEGIIYITTHQNEALKEKNRIKGIINGIYNIKAKRELKKLLSKLNREETIIHIHGWTKALSSSVFDIAFKMDFKVVLTLHDYFSTCPNGGYFNYKKNEICKKQPLSLKCIFCNCDSRNYMFKIYRIIRQIVQNKIVKLPQRLKYAIAISDLNMEILKPFFANSLIKKIFNPINLRKDYSLTTKKAERRYYTYIGRICQEKGIEIFCKAISDLNYEGIVIGDGKTREKLIEKYPNIKFVGWKSEEEISSYLRKSKFLIFPSLWYEGAPLTPLEALSNETPCFVSNVCAAREYDKDNVFLFEPTIENLQEKIQGKEYKFKRNNYLYNFDENVYVKSIIEFYNMYE